MLSTTEKSLNTRDSYIIIGVLSIGFILINYFTSPTSYALNNLSWLYFLILSIVIIFVLFQFKKDNFYYNFKIVYLLFFISVCTSLIMRTLMFNYMDTDLKEIYVENQIQISSALNQGFEKQHNGYKVSVDYEKERENILRKLSPSYMILYSIIDFISALFQSLIVVGSYEILRKLFAKYHLNN